MLGKTQKRGHLYYLCPVQQHSTKPLLLVLLQDVVAESSIRLQVLVASGQSGGQLGGQHLHPLLLQLFTWQCSNIYNICS
jgi:hypothetical protein